MARQWRDHRRRSPVLMFVGERPTEQEEQLLNKMIEAMGLSRDQSYSLTSLACAPHLRQVIIALGDSAAQALRGLTRASAGSFNAAQAHVDISSLPSYSKPLFKKRSLGRSPTRRKKLGIEIPKT